MRTLRTALLVTATLALSGCFTNHFERDPTPANFVADGVNNTVTAAACIPLAVLAVPVLAVHGLTDAIHTEPCGCDCGGCADPCMSRASCTCCEEPCYAACPPPPRPCTLPARWYPGWEHDVGR